jgi:hypothetical protein
MTQTLYAHRNKRKKSISSHQRNLEDNNSHNLLRGYFTMGQHNFATPWRWGLSPAHCFCSRTSLNRLQMPYLQNRYVNRISHRIIWQNKFPITLSKKQKKTKNWHRCFLRGIPLIPLYHQHGFLWKSLCSLFQAKVEFRLTWTKPSLTSTCRGSWKMGGLINVGR